ncbi:MAG: flagellar biosynthesis anti-sigma factor FlgM [Deltaproteobacteria bacterium]|nr:flagellar biosynthesis anti-sigma factor FlgM [Deltaproteobacteria bacterium]
MNAEVRQAKVSRLKYQITQELYRIDARAVAHAILVYKRRPPFLASTPVDTPHSDATCGTAQFLMLSSRGSESRPRMASPPQGRKLRLCRRGTPRTSFF